VNHLKNCCLCHAQSLVQTDLVRGLVPTPGQALPAPVTTPRYYEGKQGTFVRADITYLRQDFSVFQTVANPDKWPEHQRYDYLTRLRPLSKLELSKLEKKKSEPAVEDPSGQKKAIISALREITGKDLGSTVEAWQKLIPKAELKTKPLDDPKVLALNREVAR